MSEKAIAAMYGNNFDYGNPDDNSFRDEIDKILADTRSAAGSYKNTSLDTYNALGTPDFASAGVGNVSSFLEDAYTPYVNDTTTDYATFMADTPQRIIDNIAAQDTAYQAGKPARDQSFQDLLKEVQNYTYEQGNYTIGGGGSDVDEEIAALKVPKFKDKNDDKVQESLDMFKDLYGNKFSKKDYDAAIAAGQNPEKIEKRLMDFNAAGANIGDKVFTNRMGYSEVPDGGAGLMGPFQETSQGTLISPPLGQQYAFPTDGVNPFAKMTGANVGPMAPGGGLGPVGVGPLNVFPKTVPIVGPVRYF